MATNSIGKGVNKTLTKLRESIERGDYYEAHQMFRTIYFRYLSQKKYNDCTYLLYDGALMLLAKEQFGSGADLALLYIETLNKSNILPTHKIIDELSTLHRHQDPLCPERMMFVTNSLTWVKKHSPAVTADGASSGNEDYLAKLHEAYALTLWKEKNFSQSRYHYLHCSDGEKCAAMLIEYSVTCAYKGEVDLFLAQAVLQYLCLKNKQAATVVFYSYTECHPHIRSKPPFLFPLLNFIWFLLLALDGGKLAVFTVLCEKYNVSISRDPTYKSYLDRIGQLFFGLTPPPKQRSMIDGLLQNLMEGFAVSEDPRAASTTVAPPSGSAAASSSHVNGAGDRLAAAQTQRKLQTDEGLD